ncbi:MAG: right-handed parallel beta-helix repeat-containing protein [Methanobrevibacter sp.]|uniref:right-handed parallel beta-helix repeat-containing protein n=1 Tax=Methanobrevibacter sp. TaxID=66852 RepID=UPI0025F60BC3|nr:right-handed parallel beta-helix repeat-containing protein [Methanobrevibacter sp.]MBQ6098657.1 right-handed parallel beta-helix repeat-containing protein [Methanobrevibacter sp.]
MKSKNGILFILVILIFSISCNITFALDLDDNDLTQSNFASDSSISSELSDFDNSLQTKNTKEITAGNTVVVTPDSENPNQMVKPTIQPAIDAANSGDTIILKGNFAHCHLTINKTINILAYNSTLGPCPLYESEGAGSLGVFYITGGGSGSVINGVNLINNARAKTPFGFLIRGANNISINDCTIDYQDLSDYKFKGIVIENSNNIHLSNLIINNTIDGIKIINSSNIDIKGDIIRNSENQAISIIGNSENINVINNSIIQNKNWGVNLASANYISFLNNIIKNNGLDNDDIGSGIYVNTNITSLVVKGNIFINNGLHAIMYDYRARNLNNEEGAENLTIVDNNYFEGHSSMVLHHRTYLERDYGYLKYDAENDVFGDVGEGTYAEGKSYVYMRHALIFNDVPCGFTYYSPSIPWTLEAPANNGKYDFSLRLKIEQVKNGVYKVSIVDCDGKIASDFNSFDMIFFLNNCTTSKPQQNDVYKKVSIKNGVAVADFRDVYASFKSTGNVITAVFPGSSQYVANNFNVKFSVKDSDIPINPSTKIIASKLTTYPLSDCYYSVKLVNSKGKAIGNQKITFKFNGKTYSSKTDSKGIAKVKVSLSGKKTYSVTISYAGNNDYKSTKATSSIIVKTGSKKSVIKASNIKVKKNKKKTYQFRLTDSSGKGLKNQKVTVKLNGKSFSIKTNSKGIAKISFKLSKAKKYKISMVFLGDLKFKAVSKTKTVTVTK